MKGRLLIIILASVLASCSRPSSYEPFVMKEKAEYGDTYPFVLDLSDSTVSYSLAFYTRLERAAFGKFSNEDIILDLRWFSPSDSIFADTTVISHLIADHSPGSSIDDQPDIAFDAADFDVSLISSKGRSFFVRICVNKRFDTDGGGFTVVGDHLVGYGDAMDVFHGLCGFSEGQTEIDPVGEAQGHDVSAVFSEFQRRCILRQGGDIHLEEIYREFTVDVMQLIFVFAVVLIQICLVNLLEVVEIVRALGIHAFMDDEMLPVFLTGQRMGTVRTLERKRLGETALIW